MNTLRRGTQTSEVTVAKPKICVTESEYTEMDNDSQGFCLKCHEPADSVEPDACNYTCDSCGAEQVFGAAELLLMGRLIITEDKESEDE